MADQQSEFWSTVAPKYDRVVDLQIGPGTRSMARERLAREGRLGDVVEFGCGTGFYTAALAERANSVVATDLSPGMLALAKARIEAPNVAFQVEDCQKTSLPAEAFDTAFVGLVLHFTAPRETLVEMRRILKPGGTLLILNLDPRALTGLDRLRSLIRISYQGVVGYRLKPPRGFGRNVLTAKQLCDLLATSGFEVAGVEMINDGSRSSNVPVEYVRAVKA